jgi:hypothetical protein
MKPESMIDVGKENLSEQKDHIDKLIHSNQSSNTFNYINSKLSNLDIRQKFMLMNRPMGL